MHSKHQPHSCTSPRFGLVSVLTTPHDPDVRYGHKGIQDWVGYTLQVTETVTEKPVARFITDIEITSTLQQDNHALPAIQKRLQKRQVIPNKQYVDQGYMSGKNIDESLSYGINLRGLVRKGNMSKPEGFRLSDFGIDIDARRAICPAGKQSVKWARAKPGVKNLIAHHVSFGKQCQNCIFFGKDLCTDKPTGRKLGISAYHQIIQARRLEAQSKLFHKEMHHRADIEGTISELVRAHGARRSRYRGLVKNRLQACFTAVATNLKRLAQANISWHFFKPVCFRSLLAHSLFITHSFSTKSELDTLPSFEMVCVLFRIPI
jgi:transposase